MNWSPETHLEVNQDNIHIENKKHEVVKRVKSKWREKFKNYIKKLEKETAKDTSKKDKATNDR